MPMDWLALWGIQTAVGFLFTPVMQKFAEDLGKDLLKDILKDVIKGLPGNILQSLNKEDIDKAVGKAIKEFLEILQQELIIADLSEDNIKQYNPYLTKFLRIDEVKKILGKAFHPDCKSIDTQSLEKIWYNKNLLALPDDFDWRRVNKPYINKVKAIIRESDKLRVAFDSYNIEKTADNTQELVGVPTDFDLPRYQEAIRQKYGNLKLDSLDTSGAAYNELRLQQVFIAQNMRECVDMLPHVFERRKEYQKCLQETGQEIGFADIQELERSQRSYIEAPIRSVIDIINENQSRNYIVILGDPGAGKSTLLQFVALNWASAKLTNYFNQKIPILIELRNYVRQFEAGRCKKFLEYLHEAPGTICHLNQLKLHEQLQKGNAIVMFDGLDEVFNPAQREDIVNDIIRFSDEFPNIQIIVTSRVIGYKDERFRNSKFRHFMLQDFDKTQIQDFINRWHELTFNDKTDAADKKGRLERGIERSKAIQELAGNPLLLTMMAILNRHRELPRDRNALCEKASELLLQYWDAERHLTDVKMSQFSIDLTDKQAMLRQVAYHMHINEKGLAGNLINSNDLQQILQSYLETIGYQKISAREAAKVLIEQLRYRNFILCNVGNNYYAFIHRIFLEYFCAEAFRFQLEKGQNLTIEQLKNEVFGRHYHDENWHEVLKLIVKEISFKFVAEIIDYLMKIDGEKNKFINLFLAAKCLAEVRERKNQDIYPLDKKLFEVINGLVSYGFYCKSMYSDVDYILAHNENVTEIRTLAVTTIATTWSDDPDTLSILKQYAQTNNDSYVRGTVVQELAHNFKDDPDTLLILKQYAHTDDDSYVRDVAVQELARNFKDDPDTLPWLKQCAQTYDNSYMRDFAVRELARNFKDDPDTLLILKQCPQTDDDSDVRCAAVQELARNFQDDPGTLPWLKQCIQNDDDWNVRCAAVQELARNFKDDPSTLPWLKQCIQNDDDWNVQSVALQELAHNFKDDSDTLSILKQCTQTYYDSDVRRAALQELARNFKDDSNTLSILKQRAQTDNDSDVRRAVLQELARNFRDNPDTLSILKQRAQTDNDSDVRRAALQELTLNFKDDSNTLSILKQRAQTDNNRHMRRIALQGLVRNFKDDSDTLSILKQRAQTDNNGFVRCLALQELARNFRDNPDTLSILKQCVQIDDDSDVRGIAVQEVARIFQDDLNTLCWLKQCFQTENDRYVRCVVVHELAYNFKDETGVFEFFYDLVVNDQFQCSEDKTYLRRVVLEEILQYYPKHSQVLPLLRERSENDLDEELREWAKKQLQQLKQI